MSGQIYDNSARDSFTPRCNSSYFTPCRIQTDVLGLLSSTYLSAVELGQRPQLASTALLDTRSSLISVVIAGGRSRVGTLFGDGMTCSSVKDKPLS